MSKQRGDNSNIGQVGVESIRLGGSTIDNLPMREGAIAGQQLHEAEKSEKENKELTFKPKITTSSPLSFPVY
mgnify:CR=1 FL=1